MEQEKLQIDTLRTRTRQAVKTLGGARKVAADLGLTVGAIYLWPHVPAKRLSYFVERGCDARWLRPDLFSTAPNMESQGCVAA